MDKKELQKKIAAGAVAAGVCIAAAWGVASYWTGNTFQPGQSSRAFRNNQVLFDEERTSQAQGDAEGKDSFWEDDRSAEEVSGSQQEPGYLFTPEETVPNSVGIVGSDTGGTGTELDSSELPGTVIDTVGTADGSSTVVTPGGTTDGSGSGSTVGGTGGSTVGSTDTPTVPPLTGDGTVSNPFQGGTVLPDPDLGKEPPDSFWGDDPIHITDKVHIPVDDDTRVLIFEPLSNSSAIIYKGQVLDAKTIFTCLDTYVVASDGNVYYWDLPDLGKTFRIDKISFDNEHWHSLENTVTVPEQADTLYLQVSYRFRTIDQWISYDANPVEYSLKDSRVFLLNTTVKDETKIAQSQLVNFDPATQNLPLGKKANLMYYQSRLIEERENIPHVTGSVILKHLFPGWQENGQFVPLRYPVTPGRHVLQAPKSVSYDTKNYQIELRLYDMLEDYTVFDGIGGPGNTLSYLQTLTYYKGKTTTLEDGSPYLPTLKVPNYTQAVDFPYSTYLAVDTLEIPKTTVYVNTDGAPSIFDSDLLYDKGLQVRKAYSVEAGNPRYTAKDGILYNQDGTQMLGVPSELTALSVPEGITSVHLPYRCQLKTLTLQTRNAAALPAINYQRLPRGSMLLVDESVLDPLLKAQADTLRSSHLYVSPLQNPEKAYRISDSLVLDRAGTLHAVLDEDVRWLSAPEGMTGMEPGCLQGLAQLAMVHLPTNGEAVTLPQGCFDGAPKLQTLVCYSASQYEAALAVAPQGVHVLLAGAQESNGYRYLEMEDGQILLLQVPEDLTEFDGRIPTPEGSTIPVNAISNDVFSSCGSLMWVDLPKETTAIGQNAFRNCFSLQGVVIGADTVMLGKNAFTGCTSLRFVASNASKIDLRCPELALPCQEDPDYRFLFSPVGGQGYNPNWGCFSNDPITSFRLVDCGGTKVLYGLTDEDQWLALRAGSLITGPVTLPEETEVIHIGCFQNAVSSTGAFTLNWVALERLASLSAYCFSGSSLGTDVTLPTDLNIETNAFQSCAYLERMVIPGEYGEIQLHGEIFTNCISLESVEIGQLSNLSALPYGLFNNCSNLTQITFTGDAPRLSQFENGCQFRFNYSQWDSDALEEAHLRITVPQDRQEDYLENWRYGFAGYMGDSEKSGYQALWDAVVNMNIGKNLTEDQIRKKVDSMLLSAENHVRALLGLDKAEAPIHRFQYTVDKTGMITLTAAKGVDYIELTASAMDMPEGWFLDYIAANAFRESPNLRMVLLPEALAGFYSGAFSGVTATPDDTLCIGLGCETVPSLLGFQKGVPFSFGVDDDCIEILDFMGNLETQDILNAWLLPMAGYESLQQMAEHLFSLQEDADEASVTEALCTRLLTAENRLRTMLKLEPITSSQDLEGVSQEEITQAVSQLFPGEISALNSPEEPEEPEEAEQPQDTEPLPTPEPEETEPDPPAETTLPAESEPTAPSEEEIPVPT